MDSIAKMTIGIAGHGNVATHLLVALRSATTDLNVEEIDSRHMETAGNPDVMILAVSDNAISEVSAAIPENYSGVVVHVSGTTPMTAIAPGKYRRGVMYPLQTFSRDVALDYSSIPFFIEGEDEKTEKMIHHLASLVSASVYHADSGKRKKLHLAGVIACNFSNHLIAQAGDILKEADLPIDVMGPLLHETVRKAMAGDPRHTQTGPAARNDTKTISTHLSMLEGNPRLHEIYRQITESIISDKNERNQL